MLPPVYHGLLLGGLVFFILRHLQKLPIVLHRVLFFSLLAFVLVMSLIPGDPDSSSGFINDKIMHVLVFFVLTFVMELLAYPSVVLSIRKPVLLMMFGFLIEVLQGQSGYREYSLEDVLANSVGILAFYVGEQFVWCFQGRKSKV